MDIIDVDIILVNSTIVFPDSQSPTLLVWEPQTTRVCHWLHHIALSRPRGYKTFSCSTLLSMEISLLINMKCQQ